MTPNRQSPNQERRPSAARHAVAVLLMATLCMMSCREQKEHIAPAVNDRDSVAMMVTYGVNMLISDSGIIRYRIVAERCMVNQTVNPKRTIFDRGVLLTQFDDRHHVHGYIQADTAYKYDELHLIELRGRVRILNRDGLKFRGEELFWDQAKREYYSNKYSYLETPERTVEGQYFRSDENMRKYYVSDSKGSLEKGDVVGDDNKDDTANPGDTTRQQPVRPAEMPRRRQP